MSILNEASLVITPTAYKEDKLYSIIPKDDSGNLVWTRATDATRVNKDGYIERVPWNLLSYSEQFDNAYWGKSNVSITSNTIIAPNGTLTADSLIENTNTSGHYLQKGWTCETGKTYTNSVYAKANTRSWILVQFGNTWASFNLTAGTIGSKITVAGQPGSFVVQDCDGGWYRCSATYTAIATSHTAAYYLETGNDAYSYSGNGVSSLYVWGAQLTEGSVPKDYFPTTDRLDVPRIAYPTTGGNPSILIEPQRTNLVLQSSSFDSASWEKFDVTISANATTAPDGNMTADAIIASIGASYKQTRQFISISANIPYVFSYYIKKGTADWVSIREGQIKNELAYFNINTGAVGSLPGSTNSGIEDVGNGWYRIWCTASFNGTLIRTGVLPVDDNNGTTYSGGDNVSPIFYVWGAQLEQGTYPTSYIPTVASSVTRVSDVASKTGISSLLNPSEGTFLIESSALANDLTPRYIGLGDGTDNNFAVISYQGSNQIQFDIRVMTSYFRTTVTVDDITLNKKILLTWKDNSIFAFINGVKYTLTLVAGSGNGIPTALNRIDFGLYWGLPFYSKTKLVAVWKTQLTDTQCIQLTTL